MFSFKTSPLFALVAIVPLVASLPNLPRSFDAVSRDTMALAYDADTGLISMYNKKGKLIGTTPATKHDKRATGTCADLSANDVKSLPGWGALEEAAKSSFGTGSYNLATNIANENGYPAQACVSTDQVVVTLSGDPSCTSTTQKTAGVLVGTSGTATLTKVGGTTSSTTTTTTKSNDFTFGESVTAEIKFPDIVDLSATFSTSATFTNTLSSAAMTGVNQQETSSFAMTAKEGEYCHLEFINTSCIGYGTGSVAFIATGWAWFEYDDQVNGHYFWALYMNDILPNAADRMSTLEFSAAISATDISDYNGSCE
ncbi:hypothetical protein C8R43DRAFT_1133568 [Mycena crocata]|nr:hypothetical protein C8R43DRAFT_1133568 [Mycena crocata]